MIILFRNKLLIVFNRLTVEIISALKIANCNYAFCMEYEEYYKV